MAKCNPLPIFRNIVIIISSFICGFYIGYMNASSVCDPMLNGASIEQSPISLSESEPQVIHNNIASKVISTPTMSNQSKTKQSNYFDTTFEWQFFRNRNTELSPYYVPHHKIIFCGIPKNAISMWKMVILRLLDDKVPEWWLTTQATIHAWQNGLQDYRLWHLNVTQVTQWMTDPSWYKVAFIRDPLERTLYVILLYIMF